MNTTAPTSTAPAATIATPSEKPSDLSQLERQLKQKPNLPPKIDLKSLDQIPDSAASSTPTAPTPTGFEAVPEKSAEDFLKMIENKESSKAPEETSSEENQASSAADLDFSDIDLTKDPESVAQEEKPKKKSKEDNLVELRKKAESYEEKLKSKDGELAQYRERLEKMEAELERTAFEKSPKFKDRFQAPYQIAVESAVAFAKEIVDDPSVAEKALSLKGKERIEFIDETFQGGAASAQFLSLINDADAKRNNLESAMANYKQTNQAIVADEERENAAYRERVNAHFERVKNHMAAKIDLFRTGDDDSHNKAVEQRIAAARAIVEGTASQNEQLVAPFLAVIAREAVQENAQLKAELAKYKERVKRDVAVVPGVKRGATDAENDQTGKPKGAMESIRSYFR
jgi:hypothetical protein